MNEYLDIAARCMVGLVFAAAVFGKVRSRASYSAFLAGLRAMRVVRPAAAPVMAATAVTAEAAVPILLMPGMPARVGFALAMALLLTFTVAVVVVLRRGTIAVCPCFGTANVRFGRRHVVRNAILLVAAAAGAWSVPLGGRVEPGGVAVAVAAAVVIAVVVVALEDLADLVGSPASARPR